MEQKEEVKMLNDENKSSQRIIEKNLAKERLNFAIKKFVNQGYIKILPSGSAALFCALAAVKKDGIKTVIIPDSGGWIGYKTLPKYLGLKVVEVKTDKGLLIIEKLKEAIEKNKDSCLLFHTLGGYYCEQPTLSIRKAISVPILLDVTGSFGSDKLTGDYTICSFSKGSSVNFGYGGFFATNNGDADMHLQSLFRSYKVIMNDKRIEKLIEKINAAGQRQIMLRNLAWDVKRKVSREGLVQRDKQGLNVVVEYSDEAEKQELIGLVGKFNLKIVECPNYNRYNKRALSFEINKLN